MRDKKGLLLVVGLVVVVMGASLFIGNSNPIQAQSEKDSESKPKSVIGYVDVMAIFEVHPEKAKAEQMLNQEAMKLQSRLEDEIKDMSKEERQTVMEKYQKQLKQKESELLNQVIKSIDETITQVASEEGIKVVMEKENVIYGGIDLTEKVKEIILQKYSEQ